MAAPPCLVHGPQFDEGKNVPETLARWCADAAFIATARTDLPAYREALVIALEALQVARGEDDFYLNEALTKIKSILLP